MRLPGGDGAGLEDQATRGSALWGDKWDSGGLPRRSKWAKSQGRGTSQPGYFTGGRVHSPLRGLPDSLFHPFHRKQRRTLMRVITQMPHSSVDLSKYFDTIPHWCLMPAVAKRVSDGSVLRLIQRWLRAPIVEQDTAAPKECDPTKAARRKAGSSRHYWPISISTR